MRLKVADVLIDDGTEIRKFVDREGEMHKRGADIYALHEQLWEVSVYVHRSLTGTQQDLVLISLSTDLDMSLRLAGAPDDGDLVDHPPHQWRDRAAIRPLKKQRGLSEGQVVELFATRRQRAARGQDAHQQPELGPTLVALTAEYEQLLDV